MGLALGMALEIQRALAGLHAAKRVPRQQQRLERRLRRGLRREFSRFITASMGIFESSAALGRGVEALADPLNRFERAIGAIFSDHTSETAAYGRRRLISEMERQGIRVPITREISERMAEQFEEHAFNATRRTMERVTGNVEGTLRAGFAEGLSTRGIREKLRDVFTGMETYELDRVARTETNRAQSMGAQRTMEELGVQFEQWISAEDERVRESHVDMHGQIIRVGDRFSNGLRHPGDPDGAPEEVINCRCRAVPFLVPEGKRPPDQAWFYEDDLVGG